MAMLNSGKVYCIRSPNTDNIYIGSTSQTLSKRLYEHKNDHKQRKLRNLIYTTSYNIIEHGEAYIELLKEYPNITKE